MKTLTRKQKPGFRLITLQATTEQHAELHRLYPRRVGPAMLELALRRGRATKKSQPLILVGTNAGAVPISEWTKYLAWMACSLELVAKHVAAHPQDKESLFTALEVHAQGLRIIKELLSGIKHWTESSKQ